MSLIKLFVKTWRCWVMGSNWQSISLENFAQHQKGFAFKSKDYIEKGVAVVRVSNLNTNSIDISDLKYVSGEVASNKSNFRLAHNDVIIATVGSWPKNPASVVGKVVKVPRNCDNFLLNQNAVRFRVKSEDPHDQLFLYYLLKSKIFSDYIISTAQGSANQASITLKDIYAFEFECPSASERKEIANILSAIDDKASLNNQTNQTLEQVAQALFKSWFVDFDPVFDNLLASVDFKLENLENRLPDDLKLKAQRRLAVLNSLVNAAEIKASLIALAHELQTQLPTKKATQAAEQVSEKAAETPVKANYNGNPKILAQHANTHAHFPNEFEHNEQLGWIPKGWTASNVGAEFDVVMGQSPPGSSYNEEKKGIPFFQGKTDYGFRFPTNRVYCTSPKRLARKNDTLVSVRAPVGTINLAAEDCAIGRGLAAVRHKSGSISFTYYAMNDLAKHFAVFEGEGTVFGSINQKDFNAITQLSYPLELILYFSSICSNWDNKIEQVSHQTIVLTKIRDTLLPKLISGELQIPYTSIVEEIVD